jgi:hypothetical protein
MMKHKSAWVLVLLLLPFFLQAQNYHWESTLERVSDGGFHRILLSPEITSCLNPALSDIRIYDSKDIEKPFLVYKDTAHRGVDRFVPYQIIDKEYKDHCCSHIVVKNTLGNAIDEIVIEVNNADARRNMNLSGSYDGKQWFALKDRYEAVSFDTYEKGARKTTSLLKFSFPKSEYPLYKFEFDDWRTWWHDYKYPIFIVRAGYIEPTFVPEETLEIPPPSLNQTVDKKLKQSVIRISFTENEYADHLRLKITQPANERTDYYRAASLYEVVKKDSTHTDERLLCSTILSSLSGNEFNLNHTRIKDLLVRITNLDDQPLVVGSIQAFVVKHYLVASLNPTETYVLRYGCDSIRTAQYDLQYFRDKVPPAPEIVLASARKDIFQYPKIKTGQKNNGFFNDKSIVWAAIVLVGAILAFMALRMLKEMKKGEDQ